MIEIYPNLYIGNEIDYEASVKTKDGWRIVHACKEPYHRQALGYRSQGAPKTHSEYLVARRDHRLMLNMIDPDDPAYIPKELVDAALEFIHESLAANMPTLVHCNQRFSRSAGLGLLYLAKYTDKLPKASYVDAERAFREIYPPYMPSAGVRGFLINNWDKYVE